MFIDPLLKEIRKIRDEYAAEFKYDIDAIYLDLKKKEKKNKKKFFHALQSRTRKFVKS